MAKDQAFEKRIKTLDSGKPTNRFMNKDRDWDLPKVKVCAFYSNDPSSKSPLFNLELFSVSHLLCFNYGQILQNLSVAAAAAAGLADSTSKLSSIGVGILPGTISGGNFGSLATVTTMTAAATGAGGPPSYRAAKRMRPKTVPASYTSGSGSANKSASFSHLPEGKACQIS